MSLTNLLLQYYLKMAGQQSLPVGVFAFLLVIFAWMQAHSHSRFSASSLAWINATCWLLQFWGHGVHERRAPALLTNLSQALLMAPLFSLLVCPYAVSI